MLYPTIEQKNEQLLQIKHDLEIIEISGINEIEEFSKFVFNIYKKNYSEKYKWEPDSATLQFMIEEDLKYREHAKFFIINNKDLGIVGSLKITKKNDKIVFPIETEFGINLTKLINQLEFQADEFWHFGRLAINKEKLKMCGSQYNSMDILKQLLMTGLSVVCHSPKNKLVAEIDYKVFRLLNQIGINLEMIGMPKNYMGSNTVPAIVTAEELSLWMFCNQKI